MGKELFARAVHEIAGLKGEFVAVSVAGLARRRRLQAALPQTGRAA